MKLPLLVNKLTQVYDGWVVGSAADPTNSSPRDWDIVLTLTNYLMFSHSVMDLMREQKVLVTPNQFGGWKVHEFISEGNTLEVDVWADTLENLLARKVLKYIWHPKSGVRWIKT